MTSLSTSCDNTCCSGCQEKVEVRPKAKSKPKTDPRIQTLRSIFRNLHAFRAMHEDTGIYEITDPNGVIWSLWDIENLYETAVNSTLLPIRQRQAIELFLVLNLPEDRVAEVMNIKISNPVGMYATSGLTHLLKEIDAGNLVNPWIDSSKVAV